MACSFWTKKNLLGIVAGLLIVWLAFVSFVTWAMYQPPEKFARIMSYMPGPVAFLMAPFETLWTHARGGHLQVGDSAPNFNLVTLDKSAHVDLASLTAKGPVVLVFGSYT